MAQLVSLLELRRRAREYADQETSDPSGAFVDDAELTRSINDGLAELYDLMVEVRGDLFFATTVDLTTVAGQTSYDLPDDFYSLTKVIASRSGSDQWCSVPLWGLDDYPYLLSMKAGSGNVLRYRLQGTRLVLLPVPVSGETVRVMYVPTFTPLVSDLDSVDGVNGWADYAALSAAIDMMQKEESDPSVLLMKRNNIEARIRKMVTMRDDAEPEQVPDGRRDGITRPCLDERFDYA